MKARIANAARQQSANQLELKQNLNSLRTTIEMALAIDEQLQSEIERADALRKRIAWERRERSQTPTGPPHHFVPWKNGGSKP